MKKLLLNEATVQSSSNQQWSIVQASDGFVGSVLHRPPFHFKDDTSSVVNLAFSCHLCLTDSHASSTEGGLARLASPVHGTLRGAIAQENTHSSLIY